VGTSQTKQKGLHINYSFNLNGLDYIEQSFEVTSTKHTTISILKSAYKKNTSFPEIEQPKIPDLVVFKDHENNYLMSQESLYDKIFYTKEPLNQMQWQLTGNTKTILKHNCQEATTTFRGRDYKAYFTTDLPFKAAPFKFYGLPGVTLKIQTEDEQLNIEATLIKTQPLTKGLTNPFKEKEPLTWEEFVSIYKKKTMQSNNKHKAMMLKNIKKAKDAGFDTSEAEALLNIMQVIETRLELIFPENDFDYLNKQYEKVKQKN
jgi:GLPGLI family protein